MVKVSEKAELYKFISMLLVAIFLRKGGEERDDF